jgi:hypothetical protein
MRTTPTLFAVAAIATLSSVASAQFPVTSGNASWSNNISVYPGGALGIWDTGTGAVNPTGGGFTSSLIADTSGPNFMVRHGWSYRPSSATTAQQLSLGNTLNLANGAVFSGTNPKTITINDIGNASERVNATWVYTLTDGATPSSATLSATLTLTNRLAAASTFRFGVYADVDAAGTLGGDTVAAQAGNVGYYTDGLSFARTTGTGAVAYQYGDTSAIAGPLGLPADNLTNLPAVGGSASPANAATSYIYSIAVPAGVGSQSQPVTFSVEVGLVPEPTTLAGLGALSLLALRRRK